MAAKKYVYYFGDGKSEGRGSWKDLLGGKGAGLAEMTHLGIPVPAGFTITTEACVEFFRQGKRYPVGVWDQVLRHLKRVERSMGAKFGDTTNPLLVSVRSGAKASMPGMMDTVLNLGLNEKTLEGLARKTGNRRFAFDAYRRFISMFGNIVLEVKREKFDRLLEAKKKELGVEQDTQLDESALEALVQDYKRLVARETGSDFPEAPLDQLRLG